MKVEINGFLSAGILMMILAILMALFIQLDEFAHRAEGRFGTYENALRIVQKHVTFDMQLEAPKGEITSDEYLEYLSTLRSPLDSDIKPPN